LTFDPNNPAASGMVLTFDDEFNTISVSNDGPQDGTTWTNHLWYEPQGATPTSTLSVSNGVLSMQPNGGGFGITTMDPSGKGFTQKYGYFEARIWLPQGSGTWPGFWLESANHATSGAASSEIDIMEGQGVDTNGYFATLHMNSGSGADQQNSNNYVNAGTDLQAGWHTYGMLWDPNSSNIVFYLDGKAVLTVPKYDTTDSSPMMMVLGNAIGNMIGSNGGTPSSSDIMKVDWVHAYQFASQDPTAVTPQSGYDGGTAAASSASGNTGSTGSSSSGTMASSDPSAGGTTASTSTGSSGTTGSTSSGSGGPDHITVHVSGDMYNGDPQFTVTVDGKQVGGTNDVSAHHSQGNWQDITLSGNFGAGNHQVAVNFINDANDGQGGDGNDRNIYVGSITVDGHTYQGNAAASNTAADGYGAMDPNAAVMVSNGTATWNVSIPSTGTTGSSSASTTGTSQPASTSSTSPSGVETINVQTVTHPLTADKANDSFVFSSFVDQNYEITGFKPGHDDLDFKQLMSSIGYHGTDPVADHVIQLVQSGQNTNVVVDPHQAGQTAHTVVTLDNVLPSSLKVGTDILWH
jgi:beta-glucanase (GH16 family)